jgi:hypothetical protein
MYAVPRLFEFGPPARGIERAHLVQAVDGRLGLEEGPDDLDPPLLAGQVQRRLTDLRRPRAGRRARERGVCAVRRAVALPWRVRAARVWGGAVAGAVAVRARLVDRGRT